MFKSLSSILYLNFYRTFTFWAFHQTFKLYDRSAILPKKKEEKVVCLCTKNKKKWRGPELHSAPSSNPTRKNSVLGTYNQARPIKSNSIWARSLSPWLRQSISRQHASVIGLFKFLLYIYIYVFVFVFNCMHYRLMLQNAFFTQKSVLNNNNNVLKILFCFEFIPWVTQILLQCD